MAAPLPISRGGGALMITVEVEAETAVTPRAVTDDAIEFVDANGARLATYAHLVVFDAGGALVPARISVKRGRILIAIEEIEGPLGVNVFQPPAIGKAEDFYRLKVNGPPWLQSYAQPNESLGYKVTAYCP